jgi:hypothetical protein
MWWEKQCDSWRRTTELYLALEHAATAAYDLTPAEMTAIAEGEGASLADYALRTVDPDRAAELFRASVEELTERAKRTCGAKRYTVKKAYFIDRSVDLASHIFQAHPFSVIDAARQAGPVACGEASAFGRALLSWVIGLSVGRFVLTDKRDHAGPSTLAHLPQRALEEGNTGLPIWVDDPGHAEDMVALVRRTVEAHWDAGVDSITNPASRAAGWGGDLRKWCRSDFFAFHVSAYSKSRRKAPIYWQLATPSASYSVWLYYHRFTKDTFYTVLQDYVTPKVDHEERKLTQLVQGAGGSPTAGQRKEIAEQETFVQELRAFREQVARIAPLWNPDLDDGVIINFAPLWRLVPQHRAWQKECKECWDKLVAGDYDWAHLAMHLWPERVVPKCATDRSLAIAHGLDDVFWVEGSDTKWQSRKIDEVSISKLVEERTSAAIKEALGSRLELSNSAPRGLRKRRTNTRRALGSRSQRAHADPGASTTTEPGRTSLADADVIKKVRNAIAADGSGASKAGVLAASGVTDSQWNAAIKVLLADGAVTLTGDRRGARYRLADTRRNY